MTSQSNLLETFSQVLSATEKTFNFYAAQINFTSFCFIYSVVLLWILSKIYEPTTWRPKNRELSH